MVDVIVIHLRVYSLSIFQSPLALRCSGFAAWTKVLVAARVVTKYICSVIKCRKVVRGIFMSVLKFVNVCMNVLNAYPHRFT